MVTASLRRRGGNHPGAHLRRMDFWPSRKQVPFRHCEELVTKIQRAHRAGNPNAAPGHYAAPATAVRLQPQEVRARARRARSSRSSTGGPRARNTLIPRSPRHPALCDCHTCGRSPRVAERLDSSLASPSKEAEPATHPKWAKSFSAGGVTWWFDNRQVPSTKSPPCTGGALGGCNHELARPACPALLGQPHRHGQRGHTGCTLIHSRGGKIRVKTNRPSGMACRAVVETALPFRCPPDLEAQAFTTHSEICNGR
jgi:hypothetical protein